MTYALELADISKTFAVNGRRLRVLSDVNLAVSAGTVLWVRGPSGTGKTTLLCIAGLLARPSAGTVRIEGKPVSNLNGRHTAHVRAHKLGFVFQLHNLIDSLTVLENVLLPALASREESHARARELLVDLGVLGHAGHKASLLSGGERQRVAVARALINRPPIILADEPITGLDPESAHHVLERLLAAAHGGCAVIIASHDQTVASIADRAVDLRQGQLKELPVPAGVAGDGAT